MGFEKLCNGVEDEGGEVGDDTEELVRIVKTTQWMRSREMGRVGLFDWEEERETSVRGGSNTDADNGNDSHEPLKSRERSEMAKVEIEGA